MEKQLAPVAPNERIGALDLLRGWAMFGVLWSNLNDQYAPTNPANGFNHALSWTQDWLLESRFYSLLILLFGIGFGIQLMRAQARGADLRMTYYRRSLALLVIGVIHGTLIWRGDILTEYALVAFALVMFRDATPRQLLVWAALLWFLGPLLVRELRFVSGLRFPIGDASGETTALYARGTWLQIERIRVGGYLQWLGYWGLQGYPKNLAAFLVGLWAVKTAYLQRVTSDPRVTRNLLVLAVAAMAIGYSSAMWGQKLWPQLRPTTTGEAVFPYLPYQLFELRRLVFTLLDWDTLGGAVTYACILLLIWQRPFGARFLRPLANVGRMALTTYLTQSIVCTLLFYGYGLGWYGHRSFAGLFGVTLVLFGVQMIVSTLWLSKFRYGPAEWLWRTLTYGRATQMQLAEA